MKEAPTYVGEIVYQERYSGAAVGQWRTIDQEEFDALADAKITERRRLVVVETFHPAPDTQP